MTKLYEKYIGKDVLITCNNWFYGKDGNTYKAVFGTLHGIYSSEETLGVKTNSKSTNWYVMIGNMMVAGCQIFYCEVINDPDDISFDPVIIEQFHEGKLFENKATLTRIYNANE